MNHKRMRRPLRERKYKSDSQLLKIKSREENLCHSEGGEEKNSIINEVKNESEEKT